MIQRLINKVPIDRLIERDLRLKQSGRNYMCGIDHDSLVIDLRKNRFYWNSLGISGNALDWLTRIRGLSYRDSLVELQKCSGLPFTRVLEKIDKPTPIYGKLLDTFFTLGEYNRQYWYHRKFSDETIDHFKLGFTGKAFVIPIIVDDKLVNFQCRIGCKEHKRVFNWVSGRSPDLFNCDGITGKVAILTEGAIDAISLYQVGIDAVSGNSINYWNTEWNKYITKLNMIYVIYDHDRAGLLGSSRVSRKLLNRGYVVFWPSYFKDKFDINDGLVKFGETKLKELITYAMLPNAIHASDLYAYSREGRLYEAVKEIEFVVGKEAKNIL